MKGTLFDISGETYVEEEDRENEFGVSESAPAIVAGVNGAGEALFAIKEEAEDEKGDSSVLELNVD